MLNLYEILDVSTTSTNDDIRKAYRKRALMHHPDKNPSNKEVASEKFRQVAEAYSILSDEDARREYDADFREDSHPQQDFQYANDACSNTSVSSVSNDMKTSGNHSHVFSRETCRQEHRRTDRGESFYGNFTTGRALDIFNLLFGEFDLESFDISNSSSSNESKVSRSSVERAKSREGLEMENILGMVAMCASAHSTLGRVHRGHSRVDQGPSAPQGVVHIVVQEDGSLTKVELVTPGRSKHWHKYRSLHPNASSYTETDVTMTSQREQYLHQLQSHCKHKSKSGDEGKSSFSHSSDNPTAYSGACNSPQDMIKTRGPFAFSPKKFNKGVSSVNCVDGSDNVTMDPSEADSGSGSGSGNGSGSGSGSSGSSSGNGSSSSGNGSSSGSGSGSGSSGSSSGNGSSSGSGSGSGNGSSSGRSPSRSRRRTNDCSSPKESLTATTVRNSRGVRVPKHVDRYSKPKSKSYPHVESSTTSTTGEQKKESPCSRSTRSMSFNDVEEKFSVGGEVSRSAKVKGRTLTPAPQQKRSESSLKTFITKNILRNSDHVKVSPTC